MTARDLLLHQDPATVASTLAKSFGRFEQESGQSQAGVDNAAGLAELLKEVKGMSSQEKCEVMKKAAQGISQLPAKEQAQLISMGMKMQKKSAQQGGATPEQQEIAKLAQEAVQDVPPGDMQAVGEVAQNTMTAALKDPAKLAMVAKELPPDDRVELQKVLVENKMVQPEQQALLEHALQPNGILDQIGMAAEYLEQVKPYAMYALAVPLVEFVLGILFAFLTCDTSFAAWLRWDGFGMIITVGGFYGAYLSVETLEKVMASSSTELMQAAGTRDHDAALRSVPPEHRTKVFLFVAGLAVAVIGILCQVLWALWGLLEMLSAGECNFLVSFFSKLVIAIKCVVIFGIIGYGVYHGKQFHDRMGAGHMPLLGQQANGP